MDDDTFDRLARAFGKTVSRRWLVALAGGVISLLGQRLARGSQLGPATCGEQGAVCTLHFGCCNGLTCATSAINTSYGICVPGEGGMISTGTGLISPFSGTAVEEVAALVEAVSDSPTTDLQAERKAHIAEVRDRKDANDSERKTRLDTKRSKRKTRRDTKRTKRRNKQTRSDEPPNRELEAPEAPEEPEELDEPEEEAPVPQLKLELLFSEADGDSEAPGDQLVPIEVVRATNRDDVDVVLTRIETIQESPNSADLTTSQFTLGPGESYSFVSGLPTEDAADATNDQYRWLDKIVCDETLEGQGYRVKAAFSSNDENHEFVVTCDDPHVTSVVQTQAAAPPRKRNRQQRKMKKR